MSQIETKDRRREAKCSEKTAPSVAYSRIRGSFTQCSIVLIFNMA